MVGRESGDIILGDPEASALHAEIEFTKGAVIVRDLGSRNGTWREGKRLPQFALYRGQSFRCGTTDITLVEIDGSAAPVAGGTASGSQRTNEGEEVGQSSSTLPSTSSVTTAQTLVRGLVFPPSSTGTAPGTESAPGEHAEENTLVGQPPPPTGPGAIPAIPAIPAIGAGFPAAGAPAQVAHEPSAPVAIPNFQTERVPPAAGVPVGFNREASAPVAIPGFPGVPVGLARESSAPVAIPGFPGVPVGLARESSAPVAIPGFGAPGGVPVGLAREPSAPVAIPGAPMGVPGHVGAESSAPVAVPFGTPMGIPGHVGAESSAPVAVPGYPPGMAGVPMPVAAAPSAPLAPVANAVIKLGDAQPKLPKSRGSVDRAARTRLIKRVLMGTAIVAVVVGLVAGIQALVSGRNQAFLRELAGELPQDTVGVLALSSPRAALELLGSEIQPEVREEAKQALGLDPFDTASFEAWGFDVDAPLGVSLLDGDGMLAISAGVKDPDALRTALSSKAAAVIKAKEDLRWIERSFGDVPGLWLDEPMSVAALLPGKRVIFVLGGDADAVARHAKRVAEAKHGETLADRPGFGELAPERGKLLLAMYIDGAAGRAAIPGEGLEIMASRAALADIDGIALMLADDGPRVHFSMQTIMREGMTSLEAFQGVRRKGEVLERIPAPALAELDGVFAPENFESLLGAGPLRMGLALGFEDELRKETGLDLRTDLIGNLDGQLGWVLRKLPAKGEDDDAFAMLGYAGVKDEEAAKRTAERFFGKMQGELDLELEQVEGTTVYVRRKERDPKLSYFVHGGVFWAALGEVDVAAIVKGSGEPFRRKARIPAIEDATAPGGLMAGFVDIREVLGQVRVRLDEDDIKDLDEWAPVLTPLEALTMRSELGGRTFVVRWTLHASNEGALAGLVQGILKVAGAELVEDLARERRRKRCEELIDHILELMRGELRSTGFEEQMLDRRFELMDECRKDETTDAEIDCMMAAKNLEALTRCEDGKGPTGEDGGAGGDDGASPVDVLDQPEPLVVPYVDDIWPNRTAAGTAAGRPDAQVSYAVPLGDAPAVRGPEDALVTVVMFGDFQCPHCKRVLPTVDQLLAGDREVRLVFRHNPLAMHTEAEIAAKAALAAGAQGKFWEMHDKLFDNQHALSEASFRLWAGELGLDLVRFDRDYGDAATLERVRADAALAKRFGATGTPSFFVNGRYLGGAQPLHAFQAVVTEEKARAEKFVERRGNTRKRLYDDMIGHFAPEVVASTPTTVGTPVSEKRYTLDTSALPRQGAEGFVRVELVECGDFDCPFCKRAEATLDTVLTDYGSRVAVFWLHNPLSHHAGAEPAARAATAAGKQGKFWEMHDKLFEDPSRRSDTDFIGYARDLGLDTAQFELDLRDPATATTVTEQQKICTDNDARGTPVFYINGRMLSGAQPYDKFKEVIDQELAGGI